MAAEVLLDDLGTGDEGGNLLLFLHLPIDILLDIRMIDVNDDHLGGAARGAARLDGARRAVTNLEEAHQAGRLAAARELFAFAAQIGEVGAGAGTIFEQARFTHPQVHDAAFVDEVVGDRLDEAGVGLRMLIGRLGLGELAGFEIDIVVALGRTINAIGPMQAGVEPLRADWARTSGGPAWRNVRRRRPRIFFRVEIAALPAPIGPGAGEAVEHLLGRTFTGGAVLLGHAFQGGFIGHRAPQPGGHGLFLKTLQRLGNTGLAEILLGENVGRHLRPGRRALRYRPGGRRLIRPDS